MRLPRGCSFERSKLIKEGSTLSRVFYDEEGNEIHRASMRMVRPTGINVSQLEDPKAYARMYYRNVRRHREGRKARKPDY